MSTAIRQTWQVNLRYLRVLRRQPAYLGITLTQPIIWLLLFGALFKAVTQIPGFQGGSYVDFLTPGILALAAWFLGERVTTRFIVFSVIAVAGIALVVYEPSMAASGPSSTFASPVTSPSRRSPIESASPRSTCRESFRRPWASCEQRSETNA